MSLLTSDVYLVWDFYFEEILLKLESHKKIKKNSENLGQKNYQN